MNFISITLISIFFKLYESFLRSLPNDAMKDLTDPSVCSNPDQYPVYLGWDDIEWEIFGNVHQYNISKKEVCPMTDGSVKFFLPSIVFQLDPTKNKVAHD